MFDQTGASLELIALLLVALPILVPLTLVPQRTKRLSLLQRSAMSVSIVPPAGFVFLSFIDFFASTVYPITPEQFGGGRPKDAQIVLVQESGPLGAVLGFGPAADAPMVHQVSLLWETDRVYVVKDLAEPDGPIIQIDRDAVSAVVLGADPTPTATTEATPAATPLASPVGTA